VAFALGTTGVPIGVAVAVYDGAGPLLGTPTGPPSVAKGAPATFSVQQPIDAFSSVASVKWSFGDGSAASTGASVTHTFGATGTFTVTVTATDSVGNASSKALTVTVTAGGGPPGAKCVVPKLKGKSLSRATSLLKAAHCALGKVKKPKARKHHKLGKLVVKSSSPGAGASKPAGTKVNLTLTQAPKPKHKK
jgi:PKD repeat protein